MENNQHTFGGFILIEGPDTAGKSTQSQLLKEALEAQGKTVELLHFPNYDSPFGETIQAYLKNQVTESTVEEFLAIQMVYVADQVAAQEKIQTKITNGTWIIADRYDFSTLAYTHAKLALDDSLLLQTYKVFGERKVWDYIASMQEVLIKPDVTFVLDLPYQEVKHRKQELDGFESDDLFMEKVAEAYTLLSENPLHQDRVILKLDATLPIGQIHNEILEVTTDFDRLNQAIQIIRERGELECN